jgi:uncharacterized protein
MNQVYEQAVVRFAEAVIRWRWAVIAATLLAIAAMASGAQRLGFSTDYRVFFGPENPQLQAFDELQDVYTKNDNIMIVIEPPGDTAFNPQTLALVEQLTEGAWRLPYALRVDSVTNFQHTEAVGDDLNVAPLVEDAAGLDAAQIERVKRIALSEPLLLRRIVSSTGHVTGVNVTFQFPQQSVFEVPESVAATRALIDELLADVPGHRTYLGGANMMNNAFSEASQADMKTLYPAMYLMIVVILWLLLRSTLATLATLSLVVLSAAGAMGLAGWLGILLTPPSMTAPVIITTLAVADSVHILVTMFANMRQGMDKVRALVDSVRLNFTAILLTSVTTAMGFLTINFTDSPPLHDLGNITAMGVMLAWALSVTFLPALLAVLPLRVPAERRARMGALMERLGQWVVVRRKPVLWSSLAVSAALLALVPLNETNDLFAHYFGEEITYRQDTDYMVEHLTGLYTIEFSLRADGPDGVADPAYLKTLDAFAGWWRQNPKVMHIASITDVFRRLNKNMHGDDPAWYRLPDDRELAAQYLLLYEMSLPFGLDLNNTLNIDKSASRFVVVLEHLTSRETRDLEDAAYHWLETNAPNMLTHGVSPAVMFAHIAQRNIRSMFMAIPFSLLAISLLLIPALRSWKLGALSLVPNLLPLGICFGVWAIIDGQINFTMAVVLGVTLGIIVDFTIHFLTKYLRARDELGLTAEQAVVYGFRTVGTALVVTSAVLVAGFLILSTSAFLPNSGMAQLTAIAIAAALAADFFLLPPLLIAVDRARVAHSIPTAKEDSSHAPLPVPK